MTIEKRYRKRYKSGNTPWDTGQPDFKAQRQAQECYDHCKKVKV